MKLVPTEKATLERLSRAFRKSEVHGPHTPHNHTEFHVVKLDNDRAVKTIAELINHELEGLGEAPAVFPTHVAEGRMYDTPGTKTWLAVDLRHGLHDPVLETIESAPRRIHALMGTGKSQLQR